MDYLGRGFKDGCLAVRSHTIDAIQGLQSSPDTIELHSLLVLGNVFHQFFSELCTDCTSSQPKISKRPARTYTELSYKELEVLKTMKKMLIATAGVAPLRWKGTYTGKTDACDQQIGFVLVWMQPTGQNKQISY